jgi:membrane protein YdbS with pleckstrin-like domain
LALVVPQAQVLVLPVRAAVLVILVGFMRLAVAVAGKIIRLLLVMVVLVVVVGQCLTLVGRR